MKLSPYTHPLHIQWDHSDKSQCADQRINRRQFSSDWISTQSWFLVVFGFCWMDDMVVMCCVCLCELNISTRVVVWCLAIIWSYVETIGHIKIAFSQYLYEKIQFPLFVGMLLIKTPSMPNVVLQGLWRDLFVGKYPQRDLQDLVPFQWRIKYKLHFTID